MVGGANERPLLAALALFCLVAGQVVSYVKARAEAAGLRADGASWNAPNASSSGSSASA